MTRIDEHSRLPETEEVVILTPLCLEADGGTKQRAQHREDGARAGSGVYLGLAHFVKGGAVEGRGR